VEVDGAFSKRELDGEFVRAREKLVNRGYDRLWAIRSERRKPLTVVEYPLPEFLDKWR
jgi:hypothetical protein